jgi:tetratricopeptide (TPR) repeat protein
MRTPRARFTPAAIAIATLLASGAIGRPAVARAAGAAATQSQEAASRDLVKRAFRAAYNLDHDEAMTLAHQAVALTPDDPAAHRAVASILWMNILFKRGAVTVDQYMGTVSKSPVQLPKPPADLDGEFKRELNTAITLAEAEFRKNPHDYAAEYDIGTAYGLQASYSASVEGSVMAAFRSAKRAFDAQEDVLDHDPSRTDAGLIVGTYRYIISELGLPSRMLAYVVGFGGGKEKGLALIEKAAANPNTHVDATLTLILLYSREGRHADAVRLAHSLGAEFPRNRILTLEEGSAAIRAGKAGDADATLTRGLTAFDQDPRPKIPGERALWLYKRGLARISLNHPAEAQADLTDALSNGPVDWVRGRIHLEMGKVADLSQRRTDALNEYRQAKTLADANGDPACSTDAERFMRKPFSMPARTP